MNRVRHYMVQSVATGLAVLLFSAAASAQVPRAPVLLEATIPAPSSSVHSITRLPLDSNGFHNLQAIVEADPAYASARFIYVDPTLGNDSTAGPAGRSTDHYARGAFTNMFSPSAPPNAYRTVAAANAQRRPNTADVILLKRGETYASLPSLSISGASVTARAIVAAYGNGARPRFQNTSVFSGPVRYVIYADLHIVGGPGDTAGVNITPNSSGEISHILFENLFLTRHSKGFVGENRESNPNLLHNIVFHRNIFYRNVGAITSFNSTGMYNRRMDNATLDQNIFIENGWDGVNAATKDIQSRHIYVDDCRLMLVRENIMIRPASEQIQFRANVQGPGPERRDQGTMQNNLFLDGGLHVLLAENDGDVQMRFIENVVQGTLTTDPIGYAGRSVQLEGATNVLIDRNMFVQSDVMGRSWPLWPQAISLWQGTNSNIAISNNYFNESGLLDFVGNSPTISGLTVSGNRLSASVGNLLQYATTAVSFRGNQFFGGDSTPFRLSGTEYGLDGWQAAASTASGNSYTATPLPSPPTIETYLAARGLGSSLGAYMSALLAQDRNNWDPRLEARTVNSWMRTQVGM